MFQRYRLDKKAITAGIFLLLAAASMFLHHIIVPNLTDRVSFGIGAFLIIIMILLFTRRRNAACGVFFIILTIVSIIGIIAWAKVKTLLPLSWFYGVRAVCFLGLSIVCLRRRKEPLSGPWFLSVCLYVAALPAFLIYGMQEASISNNQIFYLTATDLLLFIGLLLTAMAFRYSPDMESSSAEKTVKSEPSPQPETYKVPEPQPIHQEPESAKAQPVQPQPEIEKTQPVPPDPDAARPESVEIAQVEWLED